MSASVTVLIKEQPFPNEYADHLVGVVNHVLKQYDLGEGEVSLVLADDQFLHKLNSQYRNIDAPTDVLSFCYLDSDDGHFREELEFPVGDIYISVDRAREQAAQAGHPLEKELLLLVVHGILHLCGYDHAEEDETSLMKQREQEILGEFEHIVPGDR